MAITKSVDATRDIIVNNFGWLTDGKVNAIKDATTANHAGRDSIKGTEAKTSNERGKRGLIHVSIDASTRA